MAIRATQGLISLSMLFFLSAARSMAEDVPDIRTPEALFDRARKTIGREYRVTRDDLLALGQPASEFLEARFSDAKAVASDRWLASILLDRSKRPEEYARLGPIFAEKVRAAEFGGPRITASGRAPKGLLFEPGYEVPLPAGPRPWAKEFEEWRRSLVLPDSESWSPFLGEILLKGWIVDETRKPEIHERDVPTTDDYRRQAIHLLGRLDERRAGPALLEILLGGVRADPSRQEHRFWACARWRRRPWAGSDSSPPSTPCWRWAKTQRRTSPWSPESSRRSAGSETHGHPGTGTDRRPTLRPQRRARRSTITPSTAARPMRCRPSASSRARRRHQRIDPPAPQSSRNSSSTNRRRRGWSSARAPTVVSGPWPGRMRVVVGQVEQLARMPGRSCGPSPPRSVRPTEPANRTSPPKTTRGDSSLADEDHRAGAMARDLADLDARCPPTLEALAVVEQAVGGRAGQGHPELGAQVRLGVDQQVRVVAADEQGGVGEGLASSRRCPRCGRRARACSGSPRAAAARASTGPEDRAGVETGVDDQGLVMALRARRHRRPDRRARRRSARSAVQVCPSRPNLHRRGLGDPSCPKIPKVRGLAAFAPPSLSSKEGQSEPGFGRKSADFRNGSQLAPTNAETTSASTPTVPDRREPGACAPVGVLDVEGRSPPGNPPRPRPGRPGRALLAVAGLGLLWAFARYGLVGEPGRRRTSPQMTIRLAAAARPNAGGARSSRCRRPCERHR